MNGSFYAKNFLGSRDKGVVKKARGVVRKSSAEARSRSNREPHTPGAAVQIQYKRRTPTSDRTKLGPQQLRDISISFKDASKAILHNDCDLKIGAMRFEQPNRGSGEHTIAERPETNYGDASALW